MIFPFYLLFSFFSFEEETAQIPTAATFFLLKVESFILFFIERRQDINFNVSFSHELRSAKEFLSFE